MRIRGSALLALFFGLLLLPGTAHAYIDPGSGTLILQMLLGGIVGFFVMLKIYWRRLLRALGLRKSIDVEPDDPNEGV